MHPFENAYSLNTVSLKLIQVICINSVSFYCWIVFQHLQYTFILNITLCYPSVWYEPNCTPHPNSYVEALSSVPQIEDRAFKEVIKVKWDHMGGL